MKGRTHVVSSLFLCLTGDKRGKTDYFEALLIFALKGNSFLLLSVIPIR